MPTVASQENRRGGVPTVMGVALRGAAQRCGALRRSKSERETPIARRRVAPRCRVSRFARWWPPTVQLNSAHRERH
jgi:hypothetical protein